MANKMLIPLKSLIFCFLKHPANSEQPWVQLRDSSRGYSPVRPKGYTICCVLVAVAQEGEASPFLNLLCTKGQASENCEHRSGIWQIFRQFMKWIPQHIFSTDFFLPSFNSSLRRCHCLQSIGQVITFPFLKVVLETVYLRLRLKPTWQGLCAMLSHSVASNWDLSPAKTHGAWFQDLMNLRFLMSH